MTHPVKAERQIVAWSGRPSVLLGSLTMFERSFDMIDPSMTVSDVVIVGAARTPIGRYGGSFKDVHPAELGAVAGRAALQRAGLSPADVEEVVMGHGRPAGAGPNPARQVGRRAAVPDAAPLFRSGSV